MARKRYAEVYDQVRMGEIDGYSVQGSRLLEGNVNRWWSTGEVSVTSVPCLVGARFVLRGEGA